MLRSLPQPRRFAAALLILAAAAGCRPLAVESEPGPAYVLDVRNPMGHPMIVLYDDGTGNRLLGTVSAGGETRFMITRPARLDITVLAHDENRTHSVSRPVTLRLDQPVQVTLQ